MANQHPRDGDPHSPPPIPSTGTPPSHTYASKAAGSPFTYVTAYSHPKHGHLAIPPNKNLRLDWVADLDAVAYLIPKSVTLGAALDAACAVFEPSLVDPVHSINSYPTSTPNYHRVEIVYSDEVVDEKTASTTPLSINGVPYPPMSSAVNYVITRFAVQGFFFRNDTRNFEETEEFAKRFVKNFDMGTVIKIEVPRFRYGKRQAYRNEFVFYTKSEKTADSRIPRTLDFKPHQDIPVKIGWIGAPAFCTYCKKDGHFNQDCPERLSKICNACYAPGHVSAQCARFGERDREAAQKRAESDRSVAPTATVPSTPAAQPTHAPVTRTPSPGLSDFNMASLDEETDPEESEAEECETEESESENESMNSNDVEMEETLPTAATQPLSNLASVTPASHQSAPIKTASKAPATQTANKTPIKTPAKTTNNTMNASTPSPDATPIRRTNSTEAAIPSPSPPSGMEGNAQPKAGPRRSPRVNKGTHLMSAIDKNINRTSHE